MVPLSKLFKSAYCYWAIFDLTECMVIIKVPFFCYFIYNWKQSINFPRPLTQKVDR
jgi:hypothetical protein